jgi:calcium-dependent protein kinase
MFLDTAKRDIWSVGTIAYIFLSGVPPFIGDNPNDICKAVKRRYYEFHPERFRNVSESAKDFIRSCLIGEEYRMSAAQALEHPWLASLARSEPNEVISLSARQSLFGNDFAHHSSIDILKNLFGVEFTGLSALAQLLLHVVSFTLTDSQTFARQEDFRRMDIFDKGEIDYEVYHSSLKAVMDDKDISVSYLALDYNRSDCITFHKFLAGTVGRRSLTETNFRMAFSIIAKDKISFNADDLWALMKVDISLSQVRNTFSKEENFGYLSNLIFRED